MSGLGAAVPRAAGQGRRPAGPSSRDWPVSSPLPATAPQPIRGLFAGSHLGSTQAKLRSVPSGGGLRPVTRHLCGRHVRPPGPDPGPPCPPCSPGRSPWWTPPPRRCASSGNVTVGAATVSSQQPPPPPPRADARSPPEVRTCTSGRGRECRLLRMKARQRREGPKFPESERSDTPS